MLGWLRNRISVRTGRVTLPTFTWVAEEPAQPIPLGPDDQCVKATKELIIAAVNSLDPVRQLIRADAILKASVEFRVKRLIDEVQERSQTAGTPGIACAKGCGHCCRVSVSAFPFEVFAVADHLKRNWSAWKRYKLLRRINSYGKKVLRLRRNEQYPWCPFLIDNCCSIYEVRPTICRTHHSTDLQACISDRVTRPPSAEPFYRATIPLYMGVHQALGDRGGFPHSIDMALAVGVALKNPKVVQQFAEGQDPFVQARKMPAARRRR